MTENVNRNISSPVYRQVRESLIEQIKTGRLKPGEKIPSESQLGNIFNISRITARQAVATLINDGLVYTVHGKGTFVNESVQDIQLEYITSFKTESIRKGFESSIKVLEEKVIRADRELADRLKIEENAKVVKIKRVKLANNMPVYTEERFMPYNLCPSLISDNLAGQSLTELARNVYDLKISSRNIIVSPVALDSESSVLLKTKEGSPGLFVTETLFLNNGLPFKWEKRVHKSGLNFTSKVVLAE